MAKFFKVTNALTPTLTEPLEAPGTTVREVLRSVYGESFVEFSKPTIILVNSEAWSRAEWDAALPVDSVVTELPVTTGVMEGILITLVVAAVVAAVYVAATMKIPKVNTSAMPEARSVYGLAGEANQARLGSPVEVAYGRNRMWPSYAANPYTYYKDNNQYLCQFFCLGQGEFDIEAVQIEDTPIGNMPEARYRVIPPGASVWDGTEFNSLVYPRVYTLSEVSNVELFAPNESEYPGGKIEGTTPNHVGDSYGAIRAESGWFGSFVCQPAGAQTFRIECDVVLPGGLFWTEQDDGDMHPGAIYIEFQYAQVGADDWQHLFALDFTNDALAEEVDLTLNTPRRFTLAKDVTPGSYQVRGRRLNVKSLNSSDQSTVHWECTKAWLKSPTTFANTTLAVEARATNGLNGNSQNRVNVIATRKLPLTVVYGEPFNTARRFPELSTATKNPVWAFVDVAVTSGLCNNLDLTYLDMPALKALADRLDELGYEFNYIFDTRTSMWEAMTLIAKACRCLPVVNGSVISLVRDEKTDIPVAMFAPHNIVKGSFRYETKLADVDAHDGYLVEYIDEVTWKRETVTCVARTDKGAALEQGLNPETIQLPGITNRATAYFEGTYLRQCSRLLRHNVVFKTGLEGYIPLVGDMISVSFDVPKWGVSGHLVSVTANTFTPPERLTLFEPGYSRVVFRKKDGTSAGPFTVIEESAEPDENGRYSYIMDVDFDVSWLSGYADAEPVLFMYGRGNDYHRLAKITSITPADDDTVEITAHTYEPEVFNVTGPGGPGPGEFPVPPRETPITPPEQPPGGFPGGGTPSDPPQPSTGFQLTLDESAAGAFEPWDVYTPELTFTTDAAFYAAVVSTTWPLAEPDGLTITPVTPPGAAMDGGGVWPAGKYKVKLRYIKAPATLCGPNTADEGVVGITYA